MKITEFDGYPGLNGKTKSLTICQNGCTYKISSDFFGLRIRRQDCDDDRISILPRSEKEIVVK